MGRNYCLIIALFFTVLIAWGSFLPGDDFETVTFDLSDKIVHTGSYFILTLSWFIAIRPKTGDLKKIAFLILAIGLYGIIIEILQGVLSEHRKADLMDILANFVGVMLAFLTFYFISDKIDRDP